MDMTFEEMVRERAYHIWMAAGMQDGLAHEHWTSAEQAVAAEAPKPAKTAAKKVIAKKATAKSAAAPKKPAAAKTAAKTAAKATAKKATATSSKAKH